MLSVADKRWLVKTIRAETKSLLEDMVAAQLGDYDGATEVKEDEWAEEGRVGFAVTPGKGAVEMK